MHTLILDCLRHGECEGPACLRGHTNVALSEAGWRNMEASARCLPKPDLLISSPLSRCVLMAQAMGTEWGITYETDADLCEMNFGDWDGIPLGQVSRDAPQALAAFWENPAVAPPPNAETLVAFETRLQRAWDKLLKRDARHIVMMGHAGVIKTFLAWVTGMDTDRARHLHRVNLPYAGLTRFRIEVAKGGQCWSQLLFHGLPAAPLALPNDY
ncbi:histidine phosphatase family protein [Phytohalomonas tamaricis]|uniref:histidine phosphatase family protein n=1 Tax=Phytohalomonas tamaricis TaxID=2081032 RepID=UPI000D0BD174|nr:histidine phosphatase family protein [Phytohalomonas tamaricis]